MAQIKSTGMLFDKAKEGEETPALLNQDFNFILAMSNEKFYNPSDNDQAQIKDNFNTTNSRKFFKKDSKLGMKYQKEVMKVKKDSQTEFEKAAIENSSKEITLQEIYGEDRDAYLDRYLVPKQEQKVQF